MEQSVNTKRSPSIRGEDGGEGGGGGSGWLWIWPGGWCLERRDVIMKLINRDRNRRFTVSAYRYTELWKKFCQKNNLIICVFVCVCVCVCLCSSLLVLHWPVYQQTGEDKCRCDPLHPRYRTLKLSAPVLVIFTISVFTLKREVSGWGTTVRKVLAPQEEKWRRLIFIGKGNEVWFGRRTSCEIMAETEQALLTAGEKIKGYQKRLYNGEQKKAGRQRQTEYFIKMMKDGSGLLCEHFLYTSKSVWISKYVGLYIKMPLCNYF